MRTLLKSIAISGLVVAAGLPFAASADGQPFHFMGKRWVDQEAFVKSGHRCATKEPDLQTIEDLAAREASLLASGKFAPRPAGSVTIPVHVHVIMAGNDPEQGAVTDQQIADQIAVLNAAYGGLTGGAATPFRFQLASVDRTVNAAWFTMEPDTVDEREAKAALRIGGPEALNLYTVQTSYLGWATFPFSYAKKPSLDGVVVLFKSLPGGNLPPYDLGNTATHEIGHWLGLYHTFQGSCTVFNDRVRDTPAEREATFGCPVGQNSCTNRAGDDPIHNFMDYTDDACMTEFTPGQSQRMDSQHQMYRS